MHRVADDLLPRCIRWCHSSVTCRCHTVRRRYATRCKRTLRATTRLLLRSTALLRLLSLLRTTTLLPLCNLRTKRLREVETVLRCKRLKPRVR